MMLWAIGDVESAADVDSDRGVERIGVALAAEALDATRAALVGIGDDPGFTLRAVAIAPCALAD
jgi:hypothetical protein